MQLSKYHYYITLTVITRLIYCIYYWFMISLQVFNSSIFNIRNNILLENYNFLWLPLIFSFHCFIPSSFSFVFNPYLQVLYSVFFYAVVSTFVFLFMLYIFISFSFYVVVSTFWFLLCCCIHIPFSFYVVVSTFWFLLCCCIHIPLPSIHIILEVIHIT